MVYYDGQVLSNQIAYGLLGHSIISWLKKTALVPFINKNSWWINRGLALGLATISAIGINYSYSYSTDGVLVLTLTGLTIGGVWHGFLQWLVAYGSQQLPYHLTRTSEDKPAGV
jgi:hypothetical protein